jgi:hypothetical protein
MSDILHEGEDYRENDEIQLEHGETYGGSAREVQSLNISTLDMIMGIISFIIIPLIAIFCIIFIVMIL